MPKQKSRRQTKRLEELKVAFVHYTGPSVVGGVESVMGMQELFFEMDEAGGLPVIVRKRSECDFLEREIVLKKRDPIEELRAAVREREVVIVHNVLTMPFDLPLTEALWRLAEEMRHIHWIAWIHDIAACNPDYARPWHQAPWQRLTQASPHFTYVTVSEHRARQFEALTGTKPRVIPNAVDVYSQLGLADSTWQFQERHRLLARDIVFIQPVRLVRRKRIELGLEVVAELRRRGRDAVTLITAAGDPHNAAGKTYRKELRARRDDLGLKEAAIFLSDAGNGWDGDLGELYVLSDALFFPSRDEGFGLPLLEAALHRLPVFCTDVEPLDSLLGHGVHTFAPDASPAEIATLIERTLARSPAYRARREVLRRYSSDAIWREHLEPLLREGANPSGA